METTSKNDFTLIVAHKDEGYDDWLYGVETPNNKVEIFPMEPEDTTLNRDLIFVF